MLEIVVTDEFAEWFQALPDAEAEDVATALEVLGSLSADPVHPNSSDLVLWYQALPADVAPLESGTRGPRNDTFLRVLARLGRVNRHLDSDAVRTRIARMSSEQSAQVNDAIGRIRSHMRGRRLYPMMRRESAAKHALDEIDREYRAALQLMGLEEPPALASDNGLRQLVLNERPPGIRILYGVNETREVALILLGEHLDRRAYGDSVRSALAVWERFLAEGEASGLGALPTTRRVG